MYTLLKFSKLEQFGCEVDRWPYVRQPANALMRKCTEKRQNAPFKIDHHEILNENKKHLAVFQTQMCGSVKPRSPTGVWDYISCS